MIDHISIGVRDIARTQKFYDAVMKPLGFKRTSTDAASLGYGSDGTMAAFWALKTDKPVPADAGSGLHICFAAPDQKSVDAFYKAAMAAGGKDNGKPGVRKEYSGNYYAAFVVDPDGYRIEAYHGRT